MRLIWAVAAAVVLSSCGSPSGAGDGVLTIGSLLPKTGELAYSGPPIFAGVNLAIKDINAAGGVLGEHVVVRHADSGEPDKKVLADSVAILRRSNTDAVIGAASSGTTLAVLDQLVGGGTAMVSPSNTADALTTHNDRGRYFRTAPPDKIQGRVLGRLVASDGGGGAVALVSRKDAYGVGLASSTKAAIEEAGGRIAGTVEYDPERVDPSAVAAQIAATKPSAIVLIAFAEIKKIAPELIKKGLPPTKAKWYFSDAIITDFSADFPQGTLAGVKGTLAGAASPKEFQSRLLAIDATLRDFGYAPEAYDATILTALAASAADDDSGPALAAKLVSVSRGGTKCRSYRQCLDLLNDGKDIDYDGVSGPIEFTDAGDPAQATMGIYQFGQDNKFTNLSYQFGSI